MRLAVSADDPTPKLVIVSGTLMLLVNLKPTLPTKSFVAPSLPVLRLFPQ